MKRALILAIVLLISAQATALAQEREPLAMRIEFEWTVIGTVSGAVVGAMLWLTDPADPNNIFSDSVAAGAAWGAVVGAGFGVYIMQRAAQFPQGFAVRPDPAARPRISSDPVAGRGARSDKLLVDAGASPPGAGFSLPLLKLRF